MKMKKPFRRLPALILALCMLLSANAFAASAGRGTANYVKTAKKAVIVVGDSRTWHMSMYCDASVKKNFYFVFANGKGIQHLGSNYENLKTDLINAMNKYPSATVVFMLGVNFNAKDTDSARLKIYDSIIGNKAYKKHRFIVSTIGKTVGLSGNYGNGRIKDFNAKIRSHYAKKGIAVYDLYAYTDKIITSIKNTRGNDGLHYDTGKYNKILANLRSFTG